MIKRRPAKSMLDQVRIATPCPADWNRMEGDDRVRYCGQCKLNVYNIAAMSRDEAESLIRESEGRLCLKIYRRKDGTVITDDCPVALKRLRRACRRCAAAILGIVAWTGIAHPALAQEVAQGDLGDLGDRSLQKEVGAMPYPYPLGEATVAPGQVVMGSPSPPPADIAEFASKPEPRSPWVRYSVLGAIAALGLFSLRFLRKRNNVWMIGATFAAIFALVGFAWSLIG